MADSNGGWDGLAQYLGEEVTITLRPQEKQWNDVKIHMHGRLEEAASGGYTLRSRGGEHVGAIAFRSAAVEQADWIGPNEDQFGDDYVIFEAAGLDITVGTLG